MRTLWASLALSLLRHLSKCSWSTRRAVCCPREAVTTRPASLHTNTAWAIETCITAVACGDLPSTRISSGRTSLARTRRRVIVSISPRTVQDAHFLVKALSRHRRAPILAKLFLTQVFDANGPAVPYQLPKAAV